MHHHADLELVEVAAAHRIAREVELRRIIQLDEAVVLLGEEPHDHAALAGILVGFDLFVLEIGNLLKLALDGIEGIVERRSVVLLGFTAVRLVLADDGSAAGDVRFD